MEREIKILVVDDEQDILQILSYNLAKEGYHVKTALEGKQALNLVEEFNPHLVILDIMMPGITGIQVCEEIRKNTDYNEILICFLTARSGSFTQISALDSGGDDFISKPIKPQVLLSRVKAILRRHPLLSTNLKNTVLEFGDLKINLEQYEVSIGHQRILLAKKEFELLVLLTSKPGKVFQRREILSKVWGREVIVGDRTIDVHIRKLREKIGSHYIQTMKGVGYKFEF